MDKKRLLRISVLFLCSLLAAQQYEPVVNNSNRTAFISAAKEYIGVPYLWGGRTKKGVDCSGLVYAAAQKSLDVTIPHSAALLYGQSVVIPVSDRQIGDLVFFNTGAGNEITHVGIYIGNGEVIHALSEGKTPGVTVTPLSRKYWIDAYVCTGRLMESAQAARVVSAQKGGAVNTYRGQPLKASAGSSAADGNTSGRSSFAAGKLALKGYWNELKSPYTALSLTADTGASLGLSFAKGTNIFHIYGTLSMPVDFSFEYAAAGTGFGFLFPISERSFVMLDVLYTQFIDISSSASDAEETDVLTSIFSNQLPSVRLSYSFRFANHFSAYASLQGDIGIAGFNGTSLQYRPYIFSLPSIGADVSVNVTAGLGITFHF